MPNIDRFSAAVAQPANQDIRINRIAKFGVRVTLPQLSMPLELSPRFPYVAGRVLLAASLVNFWVTNERQSGAIGLDLRKTSLDFTFENVQGCRLLIDCRFVMSHASASTIVAKKGITTEWEQPLVFDGNIGSFLTPSLGQGPQKISVVWSGLSIATQELQYCLFEHAAISMIEPAKA
jgi:hypothetical protein